MRNQSKRIVKLVAQMGERLSYALKHTDLISKYTLNEFQVEALEKIAEGFRNGEVRQAIILPGASGKTRIALALIEALSDAKGIPPRTIIKSTKSAIGRFMPEAKEMHSPLLKRKRFGEYHADKKQPKRKIVLTTNQSHRLGHARGVFTPERTTLIISDEGHHQLSPAQKQLNKKYDDYSIHITLTATPNYSAEKTLSSEFSVAYSKEPAEAIEKNIITPIDNFLLMMDDVDISKVKKKAGDFDHHEMARLFNESVYLQYAQLVETFKHPKTGKPILGQKIMANFATIQEAENCAAFFNTYFKERLKDHEQFKSLKSFAIATHSANTKEENKAFDDAFRADEHLMHVTVRKNAESYDYKKLSVILNITPTTSTVLAEQRIYRGARLDPDDPDKVTLVIDGVYRDKRKRALIASEVLGGTTYFKIADAPGILADAFEDYWQLYRQYERKSITGPRVITPDEMMMQYAEQAARGKSKEIDFLAENFLQNEGSKKRKRKYKNDIVDTRIRKQMLERNYLSIREIFNEAVAFRDPDAPRLDYHRMLLAVSYVSNLSDGFREACKAEIDVLRSKLGMPDIENHLPKPNTSLFSFGDAHEYEHEFSMDFVLPKIRQQMERMNIFTYTELFSLVQAEYPMRNLHHSCLLKTVKGIDPPISDYPPGIKKLQNLSHTAVALARLFRTDPRELFSEDQYFEHIKKFKHEFPKGDWVIAEAFGHLTPREKHHDRFIISGEATNVAIIILDRKNLGHRAADFIIEEPALTPRWMKRVLPSSNPQQPEVLRVLQANPQ